MQRWVIGIAAILLVIGGVSAVRILGDETDSPADSEADASTSPEISTGLPQIEGPPPSTVAFAAVRDIRAAMNRAGLECTRWQILKQDDPSLRGFALCDIGPAENRYNLYVFETSRARNRWMGSIVMVGMPWVLGPNWIVVAVGDPNTAQYRAEILQRAIGGQIAEVNV